MFIVLKYIYFLLDASGHNRVHWFLLLGTALVSDKSTGLKLDETLGFGVGLPLEVPQTVALQNKPTLLPGLDATTLLGAETLLVCGLQACHAHTKFFELKKKYIIYINKMFKKN